MIMVQRLRDTKGRSSHGLFRSHVEHEEYGERPDSTAAEGRLQDATGGGPFRRPLIGLLGKSVQVAECEPCQREDRDIQCYIGGVEEMILSSQL